MVPIVFGMYRGYMHNWVIDLTWCLFCDFWTKNVYNSNLNQQKQQYNMRTGTLLIRLNLDIHKCWNVIMPYSEEFHWGAIPFCEVLFSRQFWRCINQWVSRFWVYSIYSVKSTKRAFWYSWGGTFAWGSLKCWSLNPDGGVRHSGAVQPVSFVVVA